MPQSMQDAGRTRVAVAGATGRVGAALVARLSDDPVDVVALTRDPHTGKLPAGTRIATIDFDDPITLMNALEGVDRLFLAHGTSDRQVANEIAMIDAAVAAGIQHIVKLSVMGPASRLHPFDWHMQIEAHLATCPIGCTILRPTTFVERLSRAGRPVIDGVWGGAAGDGRVNLIDTRDIADVARITLLDDRYLEAQRAYHLTGPGAVSMAEIADELSRLLGRQVTYIRRLPQEHRDYLLASGASEMVAELSLGLDYLLLASVLAETTNTVRDLTGREPRSAAAWLVENIALFEEQRA